METKVCRVCKKELSIDEFHRQKGGKYNRGTLCKICASEKHEKWNKENRARRKEYQAEWREEHREEAREYSRTWRAKNSAQHVATNMAYQAEHPEAERARRKVTYAVQTGTLVRPEVCEECGEQHTHIHGHHDDYSKPLEVRWLCPKCHKRHHVSLAA